MPSKKKVSKVEAAGVQQSEESVNISKLARRLVQASAMRLQLQKIEDECKTAIIAEMEDKKMKNFESKVTVNGRSVTLKGEVTVSTTTVVDVELLTSIITPEQFKQCAKVSLKDAKDILPSALVDKCSSVKTGNPTLKVKAEGSLIVPEIQFY